MRRRVGLLLLEHLAIASGYALLGWLGLQLMPDGRLLVFWPAGGFAFAMLLLRGTSRWPALLLGSLVVTYGLTPWASVLETGVATPSAPLYVVATVTSVARTLSTVVGVRLVRRFVGTTHWPHTVRGVILVIVIAGLVTPALVALVTHSSLWMTGLAELGPKLLREAWIWFNANSTGILVVAPLLLAFAEGPAGRPRRSRREVTLAGVTFLAACVYSLGIARHMGEEGVPPTYPLAPLMLWLTLRFGAQGAVLFNLLWGSVMLLAALVSGPQASDLIWTFSRFQARLVVLNTVTLVLAAAFEERHRMREALENERRHLEARVAERTRELAHFVSLLHSSLESTADGLLVVDSRGRITAMNQRFSDLWRIPQDVLETGDDAWARDSVRDQLVDPESFMSRVDFLYAHAELESDDEVALKDGRIFERFSRPQRLGTEIVGRVWSFRDITVRRRAEAERDRLLVEESRARQVAERAFRAAQEALGLRDEFLSIAAHEMKTPLTSMKMQIQHLQRVLDGAPGSHVEASRLRPGVTAALRQMRRFQDLSDQLLDITQLASGTLGSRREPLDVREVVVEQLGKHAVAAMKGGSELRLECDGPIANECDRRGLERIVGNLLSNAIKFGAGHPITVRLEAGEDQVRLQVIDQGIGIAEEDHARIFERLERAVDSRHYGGLGLGLWIARQSVESLGGHISVESVPGKGATFTVELPRACRSVLMDRSTPPPVGSASV